MKRRPDIDDVRLYVERLMELHGLSLWTNILSSTEDEKPRGQVWLHLFVGALVHITPNRLQKYDDNWWHHYVETMLAEYRAKGMSAFPISFSRPEPEEQSNDNISLEADECTDGISVPPELRLRTSQVLQAASAYVDARRQHHGPRWMFVAAVGTIVFASILIGYGTLAHYGYHMSNVWNLIRHGV